jgi:hypothetical protein
MPWLTLLYNLDMQKTSLSTVLVGLVLATVGYPARAEAQSSKTIPDCVLEIAVRMRSGGKLDKGIHNLKLVCSEGECQLTTLSLNQCGTIGSGASAFYPRIETKTTVEGNLSVQRNGNTLQVIERGSDFGGVYTTTLLFGFAPGSGSGSVVTELTSFSGGFVKNSEILKQVITSEYEPLKGRNRILQLDCGVLLPGLPSK